MRPRLLAYIAEKRPCSLEEAQDLLQDTIVCALRQLAKLDPTSDAAGLSLWMKEMAGLIILRDRRAVAHQPDTVPLLHALEMPAYPSEGTADAIRSSLRLLRPEVYAVVCDHLDGYRNEEIARRNRCHRNTVANRIQEAAETLRCEFPSFVAVWDLGFYFECARHAKYRKQNDMAKYWKNNHPWEPNPVRKEDIEEIGVRPSLLHDLRCPDPHLLGAKRRTDMQMRRGPGKKRAVPRRRSWKAVAV